MSTFFGLELGRRALSAFQRAIDVSGHNVSNVNTPGYHRQSVELQATDPFDYPSLNQLTGAYQIGTGVEVSQVHRFVDGRIDQRIRDLVSTQEYYNSSAQFLSQLESLDSLKSGVADRIDAFFNSWQEASKYPENTVVRSSVIQNSVTLCEGVNYLANTIRDMRTDVDTEVQKDIQDVNSYLQKIRDLNGLIRAVDSSGDSPNDLIDQRDNTINELSKLAKVQVVDGSNNSVSIYLGGRAVVQDDQYLTLTGVVNAGNNNYVDVKFSDQPAGANVVLTDGKLKGMLDLRDSAASGLMYYKSQLDTFAKDFTKKVNDQHVLGFDLSGLNPTGNFFVDLTLNPEPALNMAVDPYMLNPVTGPGRLAVSATAGGVPGDGDNAIVIADMANSNAMITGGYTPAGFFSNFVSNLGFNVQNINQRKQSVDDLMTQLENLRDSVSGVSLDEEATLLTQYEKSYQAAAKVVTYYNSLYDTLMAMMSAT